MLPYMPIGPTKSRKLYKAKGLQCKKGRAEFPRSIPRDHPYDILAMTELAPPGARSSEKKRVRFKEDPEIHEYDAHESKRPRLGRLMFDVEALEGEIGAVNIATTGREAASRRACNRTSVAAGLLAEDPDGDNASVSTDWDVLQAAEEDYEEPEQLYNDAGIPFEPFHMKEEREEGYFDPESGSYVRIKKKEAVEDAWTDSLAREEVDSAWARAVQDRARARERQARGASDEMTQEDISELKQRIVGLLRPGENTLAALRRLGRARASSHGPHHPGSRPSSPPRRYHLQYNRRSIMDPDAQSEFDRLTEWSSWLMQAGEFLIHSHTREQLVGEVGGRQPSDTDAGVIAGDLPTVGESGEGGVVLAEVLLQTATGRQEREVSANLKAKEEEEEEGSGGVVQRGAKVLYEIVAPADDVDMFDDREETNQALYGASRRHAGGESADKGFLTGSTTPGKEESPSMNRLLPVGAVATDSQQQQQQQGNKREGTAGVRTSHQGSPTLLQPQRSNSNSPDSPSEGLGTAAGGGTTTTTTAVAAAAAGPGSSLQGFIFDEGTGYYYNSTLGAYYDPASSLFGDAASGRWYSLDRQTGQYILV